jgi:YHS domain-containing protein
MIALGTLLLLLSSQTDVPPERTLKLDAVELVAGRRAEGSAEHALVRGRHAYWFTSAANRAAFLREPERYQIQLGGACARMGPLSGLGRTSLSAVHGGRIYVFASEACRTGFLKAPEKLLEGADPAPEADADSRGRGAALLGRAIEWMGGEAALDAVENVTVREEGTRESGGKEYRVTKEIVLDLAGSRARTEQCWDASCYGFVLARERATTLDAEDGELDPSQRAALERVIGHEFLATLARRKAPGAIVHHAGKGEFLGRAAERVEIWAGGVSATIAIGSFDGAVLGIGYRGRGPTMALGLVEERFDDWRAVGALKLPYARELCFEGERTPDRDARVATIELDRALDDALFRPAPAAKPK